MTGLARTRVTLALGALTTTVAALAALGLVSGCSTLGYYAQAVQGHLQLVAGARPVAEWLEDARTSTALRGQLLLSQRLRSFAVAELGLPDNTSYRRFAALNRGAAVWNVVAAPELSLQLKTWCFAFMGCVGYRGYFDRAAAEQLGDELRAQGLEVSVYGVPAYSTLGWTNWLGGDPLLDSFVHWPEADLARLIFHELAHQVVYAKDDTRFNESFATAVERLGVERWLQRHATVQDREQQARNERVRGEFRDLVHRHRQRLQELYASPQDDAAKRAGKSAAMAELRREYEQIRRERWAGWSGYDRWMAGANNASLGVQAAYHDQVADFERLFDRQGRDFRRFYAEVRRLAALPASERLAAMTDPR